MDPKRWQEIERLCQTALEIEQGKRAAYLRETCAGDESLRKEVEALLEQQTKAEGFLRDPAIEDAAKALAKDQENALARDLIGRTIANYRIVEKIGQGGMGEVFLAEDTSLNRKVALKFLPPEMQRDATAHKRFIREAHSAAALDHPYICHINDIAEAEGKDFIVMEYVDGQTLMEKLRRGRLPLNQALQIATEVADALQAAHSKAIIHRDLKPSNIMLMKTGHAKVMDFGLAKQLIPLGGIESQEESLTALTRSGMTLGTLAYMSPERLRGEAVDVRSDIFSFGIVLYEMLAGVHPFKKETGMDTASAILHEEPKPVAATIKGILPDLEKLISRCMRKDPARRFQHMDDVKVELEEAKENSDVRTDSKSTGAVRLAKDPDHRYYHIGDARIELAETGPVDLVERAEPRRLSHSRLIGAAAITLVAGILIGSGVKEYVMRVIRNPTITPQPIISHINPPEGAIMAFRDGFALSPDGRHLVFEAVSAEGKRQLWLRRLDTDKSQPLAGTEDALGPPFWSPDSREIAFTAGGQLKRISAAGGPVQVICKAPLRGLGGAWGKGGIILFSPGDSAGPLLSVSAQGGAPVAVAGATRAPGARSYFPAIIPDGRHFLYYSDPPGGLFLGDFGGGDHVRIVSGFVRAEFAAPDWLVFARDEILFAQHFDLAEGRLIGEAIPLAQTLAMGVGWRSFSVSGSGTLAWVLRERDAGNIGQKFVWVDRQGKVLAEPRLPNCYQLTISHDGRRVMLNCDDLWVFEVPTGAPTRAASGATPRFPVWSPSGDRIAVSRLDQGYYKLYEQDLRSGTLRLLLDEAGQWCATDWSNDGRYLAITRAWQTNPDLAALDLASGKITYLLNTPFNERWGRFSPSGRWMAYESDESGQFDVYVRPFPNLGEARRISTEGGRHPRWRADGKELFYLASDGTMNSVDVVAGDTFHANTPKPLFRTALKDLAFGCPYDVTPDGQRFLLMVERHSPTPLTLVQNWTALIDH